MNYLLIVLFLFVFFFSNYASSAGDSSTATVTTKGGIQVKSPDGKYALRVGKENYKMPTFAIRVLEKVPS